MPTKREVVTIIEHIGLWNRRSIDQALDEQAKSGRPLKEIFQNMGMLPYGEVSPSLYFQLGIVQQELPGREVEQNLLSLITPKIAKTHRIIPWERR